MLLGVTLDNGLLKMIYYTAAADLIMTLCICVPNKLL